MVDAFNTIDHDERVNLRFLGEEAYCDGVGRSVVSLFMEEAMNSFDGEDKKLPHITAEKDLLYTIQSISKIAPPFPGPIG